VCDIICEFEGVSVCCVFDSFVWVWGVRVCSVWGSFLCAWWSEFVRRFCVCLAE